MNGRTYENKERRNKKGDWAGKEKEVKLKIIIGTYRRRSPQAVRHLAILYYKFQ